MLNGKRISDGGPLWSTDSIGHYWLMFPNKFALKVEEIREIFSQFGTVKNVTTAGDDKGLRFIQYTNLEDTKKAVEGLKNHPTVSLRPHRPQKTQKSKTDKGDNVETENKSPEQSIKNSDYRKNLYQRKIPASNPISSLESKKRESENSGQSTFKKMDDFASSSDNTKNFFADSDDQKSKKNTCDSLFKKVHNFVNNISDDNEGYYDNSDSLTTNSSKSLKISDFHKCHKRSNLTISRKISLVNDLTKRINNNSADVGKKKSSLLAKFNSLSLNSRKNFLYKQIRSYESPKNSETPSIISNNNLSNILDFEDDDDMPDLVIKDKITRPTKIILNASEIIVGNIDSYFGPGYFLHLFANYEPVAVSYIRTSCTGLRYCHVYFKNFYDSEEIEKRFDMQKLAGKSLIIMRPHRLAQETLVA